MEGRIDPNVRYVVGVDLGQASDYSAIVVLKQWQRPTGRLRRVVTGFSLARGWLEEGEPEQEHVYDVLALDRWRGQSYASIADYLRHLTDRLSLQHRQAQIDAGTVNGWAQDAAIDVVIDLTGVGRAVSDILAEAGIGHTGITITAGQSVGHDDRGFTVPKRDLVSLLQVLLQNRRLRIAGELPLASVLRAELSNFRTKVRLSGHTSYEAGPANGWREGEHDDCVLAAALGCWYGEHGQDGAATIAYLDALSAANFGGAW